MSTPAGYPPLHGPRPGRNEEDVVDWRLVWNYLSFVVAAPLRHPALAASLLCASIGAAALSLYALPKKFETEMRLLAERNTTIPMLSNPGRVAAGDDLFVRGTDEYILRRDSLIAIIEEAHLLAEWESGRAPAQRLKDLLVGLVRPPPNRDELLDILVGTLEKNLRVQSESSGTITIRARWSQPEVAARIVESAYRNFLEDRHATEVAVIGESLAILESHASSARADVQEAAEALRKVRGAKTAQVEQPRRPTPTAEPAPQEEAAATEAAASLASTRRAIEDLEEARRRRVAELQVEYTQQLGTFGPSHPALLSTQEGLRLLSAESPQVAGLKRKERELLEALKQQKTRGQELARAERSAAVGVARALTYEQQINAANESAAADQARRKLITELDRYDGLRSRIDAARMELDVARAAFKYRYSVLRPAQVPRQPIAPKVPATLAAGLFLGTVLAFAASAGRDLLGGRIVEPWQIEREFDLPVIATLQAPE